MNYLFTHSIPGRWALKLAVKIQKQVLSRLGKFVSKTLELGVVSQNFGFETTIIGFCNNLKCWTGGHSLWELECVVANSACLLRTSVERFNKTDYVSAVCLIDGELVIDVYRNLKTRGFVANVFLSVGKRMINGSLYKLMVL